jgi:hypothetical protein
LLPPLKLPLKLRAPVAQGFRPKASLCKVQWVTVLLQQTLTLYCVSLSEHKKRCVAKIVDAHICI